MPKQNWNLDHILKPQEFEEKFAEAEAGIDKLHKAFEKLEPEMSAEAFAEILIDSENYSEHLRRLGSYASLREATDQKNQEIKKLKSRLDNLAIKIDEAEIKTDRWLKGLPVDNKKTLDDKNAKRLFAAIPDLEYNLTYARESAKHTLSEKEELLISKKDITGIDPLKDLRTIIETEFRYKFKPVGQTKTTTINTTSELTKFVHDPRAEFREEAYKQLLTKHKEHADKFFLVYQSVVKDWGFESAMRGYPSPISVRNFANHLPDTVVETLLKVCTAKAPIFHNYFKFKAKKLGTQKLRRVDIYAPLQAKKISITFDEAVKTTLAAFDAFSPTFKKYAQQIINEKHIDNSPSPVKISGAFCATVSPKVTPYVLLNFLGQARDLATLAHELGHGIHSLYANKHLPSAQHSNLPLAETASTLGELLVFEALLAKTQDTETKKALIVEKISDAYATIIRQNFFVLFEIKAHKLLQKGADLEELSELWLHTLEQQFGDTVEIDPLFRYEWAYIPHIVETPFYCYAYSFGELLTMSLFKRYKTEGQSFIPKLEKLLAYGGSINPVTALLELGVDITQEKFWQGGFEILEEWISGLEG